MPGANPFPKLGRPLGGRKPGPVGKPLGRPRGVRFTRPAVSYARIKAEVLAAVAQLSAHERAMLPPLQPGAGTLPELIVGLALIKLKLQFQAQESELGGRLQLGGGVVDFKVWLGGSIVICRVQGNFWHSLPERQMKDAVQYDRLHRLGYRVIDFWEQDCYLAWAEGRYVKFVEDGLREAA